MSAPVLPGITHGGPSASVSSQTPPPRPPGAEDAMSRAERVVILGQGYVGLSLAVRAVEVGYDVVGLETDEVRVAHLQRGESYIGDVTNDRLAACSASGRYTASSQTRD